MYKSMLHSMHKLLIVMKLTGNFVSQAACGERKSTKISTHCLNNEAAATKNQSATVASTAETPDLNNCGQQLLE